MFVTGLLTLCESVFGQADVTLCVLAQISLNIDPCSHSYDPMQELFLNILETDCMREWL